MPKYTFEETKAFHVNYSEIEYIIKETYGIEYEIPCMEEVGSSDKAISVKYNMYKQILDKWDINHLEDFKAGKNPHYILYILMQDMVNNDVIPEGNYVVSISW